MKKLILSLSLALTLFSCNTDNLPKDALISDTAYKTVADLQLGLNGAFSTYSNTSIITFNSIFTDECKIGADNGGQQVNLYNQELDPSSGTSAGIWSGRYAAINRYSRIIAAAQNIVPKPTELVQYNNILGQCYAMRALCHMDLLEHFTVDPTDLTSEAVPYINFVVGSEQLPRNTVAEVRDGIIADLELARPLITNSDIYFVTSNFIDFVKGKTLFITGDYSAAMTNIQTVIDDKPLADATQYVAMFSDADNTEVIFKRKQTQNETFVGGVWYFTGTGGAFMEMSNYMYNQLDNTDVRYGVLFDQPNSDPAINLHLINKYPGNGIPFLNDQKIMRVSELYLIKAECEARLGQLGNAALSIKAVRDARYSAGTPVDTYADLAAAATVILKERNLELGYEGHRYVDLKRLRFVTNVGIVRDPLDCGGASACTLGINDPKFTLPIPQTERDTNANMSQNPGYTQ